MAFDTLFWISDSFEENQSDIIERKQQAHLIKQIMEKYGDRETIIGSYLTRSAGNSSLL